MDLTRRFAALSVLCASLGAVVLAQGTPVPRPFPGSTPPPTSPPTTSTPAPSRPPVAAPSQPSTPANSPTDASLGIPGIIAPGAQFLDAFDAGRGVQRCYLFGTTVGFVDTVAYYKQLLKDGGRELFKAPAMQQFEIGRFQEQTMVYPPSVVVKDYGFSGSPGYLFVNGTKELRFPTVIQIVPAPGR